MTYLVMVDAPREVCWEEAEHATYVHMCVHACVHSRVQLFVTP